MIVHTFLNDHSIVLMACESESEGLTFETALMAKHEFEKEHPNNALNPEISSGIISRDCKGRNGYCVVYRSFKPREYWGF